MTDITKILDDVLKCKPLYWHTNYEKEILAALRFAKAMQPRPISEAPRDGTPIMITNGKWTFKARWALCSEQFQEEEYQWLIHQCEDEYYNMVVEPEEPTHFTPLPDQALSELEEALK